MSPVKRFTRGRPVPDVDETLSERATREAEQARGAAVAQWRRAPAAPGSRGWSGTGPGAGRSEYVVAPQEWRGTSIQVCGLWPFAARAGSPAVGVPLGRNIQSGSTVCCDPVSWFQRAHLISNPSAFVMARPGIGKSSLVARMALGLEGFGVHPMVFGDLRPDYVELIRAMGGQVIELGRGRGAINVLDPGQAYDAAQRLSGKAREQVLADAHGRRLTMVGALITIARHSPPSDREESILDVALRVLDERHEGIPVLGDLLKVIQDAPDEVRRVALDRGSIKRYQKRTEELEATLMGLVSGGRLGTMFAQHTTVAMKLDRPVVFDVSSIDESETDLQAAALLACWSYGFGAINVAHALADAGLEPSRKYFVVLDELWRAIRAGRGMVDRVDALTRLNRQRGVGMVMVSHTMADLMSMPDEHDRMKARGFVERAGIVICGGLPRAEMPRVNEAVPLSRAEEEMLVDWASPGAWDPQTGREADPPGRGKFLLKVGGRPGIPVQVTLTQEEKSLTDTNRSWVEGAQAGPSSLLGSQAPPAPASTSTEGATEPSGPGG